MIDSPSAGGAAALASEPLDSLVDPAERRLGTWTLVLGLLAWVLLLIGTMGLILVWVLIGGLFYLVAQSGLVAYVRGNGARLGPQQYPELYVQFQECCRRLELDQEPEAYVLHGGGWLNAFAARFLGQHFVVLLSDVVDALDEHPDGVRFYFGHELGHIRRGHLIGHLWRMPVLWVPLLGAAYARAQERSCDLHGRACCSNADNAARALAALMVGTRRWASMNLDALAAQLAPTRGFWMSYHELVGAYPWLIKRIANMQSRVVPGRHPLAWLLALITPYGGRAGGGLAGLMIAVAIVGILAAVALPAYQQYVEQAALTHALSEAEPLQTKLAEHYLKHQNVPATLAEAGLPETLGHGVAIALNPDNMVLSLSKGAASLDLVPSKDGDQIQWRCTAAESTPLKSVPQRCR